MRTTLSAFVIAAGLLGLGAAAQAAPVTAAPAPAGVTAPADVQLARYHRRYERRAFRRHMRHERRAFRRHMRGERY